ncbi:hypothetical protein TW65_00689 [Stemphylium lycopersici]|nr:hypothetical protein TW65_00689 [Stemphylium lycopersici]
MSMNIVAQTGLSIPTTMQPATSSHLPGVPILDLNASGPEYSRWRRSVKFALETKDTWKYCSGSLPMPMPKTNPACTPSSKSSNDTQPSLLEERRAWVRRDREVKLDIFLSLAEEVMQDVFEVGPPLPPSNYTSQQILEALDDRFENVKFEAYHHAFCHFLNLHIDQFTNVEDFNKEFMAVLEDLLDYGHPLSNTQACSAYFSKLRCTQNPWVAKKLAEWDTQASEPQIRDLMLESPPWSCIRPLTTKSTQSCFARSIPEEKSEDTATGLGDSEVAPQLSYASTVSSKASHSRQISSTAAKWQNMTVNSPSRQQFDPNALRKALERLPTSLAFEFMRAESCALPTTECATPEWLNAREKVTVEFEAADTPAPTESQKPDEMTHTRPVSSPSAHLAVPGTIPRPHTADPTSRPSTHLSLQARQRASTFPPTTAPSLSLHPAFRTKPWPPASLPGPAPAPQTLPSQDKDKPQLSVEIHPALRPMTPNPQPAIPKRNPSRPRPQSLEKLVQRQNAGLPPYSAPLVHGQGMEMGAVQEVGSGGSSILSLPLQGTSGEVWDYGEWCRREGGDENGREEEEKEKEEGVEREDVGEEDKKNKKEKKDEKAGDVEEEEEEKEEEEGREEKEDAGTVIPRSQPSASTSSSSSSSRTTTSTSITSSSSSTAPSTTRAVHFDDSQQVHFPLHSTPSLRSNPSLTALPPFPPRKQSTYSFSSSTYSSASNSSSQTKKKKMQRSASLSRPKACSARRLSFTSRATGSGIKTGAGAGDSMAEFIEEMRERAVEGERRRARAWSLVRFGGGGGGAGK